MDDGSGDGGDSGDDGGGGKSFQELKDEYESGDAEWAEGEEPPSESDAGDEPAFEADEMGDEMDLDDVDGGFGDDLAEETDDGGDDLADDDLFDTVIEDDEAEGATADAETTGEPESETTAEPATTEPEPETAAEPEPETTEPETTATPESTTETDAGTQSGEGKPYLATMPEGFGMELIVVEWLEYLVEEVGVRSTTEAIDYYERIDWISEPVADDLQDYLRGFDGGSSGELTIDHHTQSLKFIGQLNGGSPETSVMGHLFSGGGSDGIQR
jgi:flagellar protein FlaE